MFALAFFIGIYSYSIFALGILGVLTSINCAVVTIFWFILLLFFERKSILSFSSNINKKDFTLKNIYKDPILLVSSLFVLLVLVNLIGALGPELAFDSLWYHLTLPKLYLLHHAIYHIPGGLLYYSDMPKLGEMLFTGALALNNTILAKVLHFSFGILVSFALYKFSRKFFTRLVSGLIVVIFYSNLVVDTESITAYIDLIRTFFEFLALWGFIEWIQNQKLKWFLISSVMLGLAITTKVLAIGSLFIFSILLIIVCLNPNFNISLKPVQFLPKNKFVYLLVYIVIFWFIALLIPLPWFIFSFLNTGNPVYPFFTQIYGIHATNFGLFQFFIGLWDLFMYSPDPISPTYLLFLPLLFIFFSKFPKEVKLIVWYSGFSLLLWYFTPQTGGGRFILPYLPAFSFICGAVYSQIFKKTGREWRYITGLLLLSIIFVTVISIGYRAIANKKYIPVIIGKESTQTFLTNNLNFNFGDFYDTDGYFVNHIKPTDMVLLYGFHNLYYVDFPFVDNSWVKKGDAFNYIAVQKTKLPVKFKNWQLIYSNAKTMVQLYKPPKGECLNLCVY